MFLRTISACIIPALATLGPPISATSPRAKLRSRISIYFFIIFDPQSWFDKESLRFVKVWRIVDSWEAGDDRRVGCLSCAWNLLMSTPELQISYSYILLSRTLLSSHPWTLISHSLNCRDQAPHRPLLKQNLHAQCPNLPTTYSCDLFLGIRPQLLPWMY